MEQKARKLLWRKGKGYSRGTGNKVDTQSAVIIKNKDGVTDIVKSGGGLHLVCSIFFFDGIAHLWL